MNVANTNLLQELAIYQIYLHSTPQKALPFKPITWIQTLMIINFFILFT